jgi:hypothetical protein
MKSFMMALVVLALFVPQGGCGGARAGEGTVQGLTTTGPTLLLPWNSGELALGFFAGGPDEQPRGPTALACSEDGYILDDPLNHRLLFLRPDGSLLVQRPLVDDVADIAVGAGGAPGDALVLSPGRSRVAAYGPRGAVGRASLPLAFLFPLLLLEGDQGLEVSSAFGEALRLVDGRLLEGLPLGGGLRCRLRGELTGDGQRSWHLELWAADGADDGAALAPPPRVLNLPFRGRAARLLGATPRGLVFLVDRDEGEGTQRELMLCDPGATTCLRQALAGDVPYQPRKQVALCRGGGVAWLEPGAQGLVIRSLGPEAFPSPPATLSQGAPR